MENELGAKNTDVEIWRRVPDDYYSPSIHVTEGGDIGIKVGGYVLVASVERWFAAGEAANRRNCLMEDDCVVQMPPVREYTARVRIKSIEKATPHIVGPDIGFADWDELSGDYIVQMPPVGEYAVRADLSNYVEHSPVWEPTFLERVWWTISDWRDWFMGR